MARRLGQRGKDEAKDPASTSRGSFVYFGIQPPREADPKSLPSPPTAANKGLFSKTRVWLLGLIVAALGSAITDSLKGTFGGLVPSFRSLACGFDDGPRFLTIGRDKLGFLVFDLYGDPSGVEADKVAAALQSLGHGAERTCDRLGSKETMRVQVGRLQESYLFSQDDLKTARTRALAINSTVAIYGGILPDGRARLTVATLVPSGSFVTDVSLKETDWPSKSRLFERLAAVPPMQTLLSVSPALGNYLYALAREAQAGANRATAAEAYVDVIHSLQKTAPPRLPLIGSVPQIGARPPAPDDSEFWQAMADGVGHLAYLTRRFDHFLVALAYRSWVFRFSQRPVYRTAEQRRWYADHIRWLLAQNPPPAYAVRFHALRLCAPTEYRTELFGDASPSAPALQKAQADFRQFATLADFPEIAKAVADCRFTEQLGFFPRWPPWRPPQADGAGPALPNPR